MREQKYIVAAIYLLAALPLGAASTGTTALHTPQGAGAGTANGDYVTASGGMDTFYRYWIEVPSGLSRLVVDLFDADFGAGGGTEDTAQRDRERGSYDSSVTYSLIDPSGATRPIRFTTGSTTLPAGGDNNWLTLYNGTGNNVRDNFGTAAYTNNDGNNNWSAAWIESDGGGGGATGGSIQIVGGELRITDVNAGTPSIQREADLLGTPGLNLGAAYLSFDYRTSNNLESDDEISVEVSGNGGGSWTTLETFVNDSSGSRTYDITAFIANNTRVRFIVEDEYDGTNEFFFVDNLEIHDGGAVTAGHWELRVDSSDTVTGGNDINGLGIRAHDGDSGSGGTEINVYYDSHTQVGVNPPSSGSTSRSYTLYPYLTSGCTASINDHDYDSNRGAVGSISMTRRGGGFTQNFAAATLSADNVWNRDTVTGWTTDTLSTGYGIWTSAVSISNYTVSGVVNGNYANFYVGNFQAAANPPGANPTANTFRVYLPNDAGTAPLKPYLEQELTFSGCGLSSGPNPPTQGQTSCFTVTVRVVNPAAQAVTFSASNLVTANIPGSGAVYGGGAQVSQGSIVSQPSVGGTGNITWNPGTLAAGATGLLSYLVNVTPTSNGQRIAVTATPASGSGTRAQFVDETGNTTQARATYLLGPVCELAATEDVLTEAVVSSFELRESAGRGVELAWTTASEVGTAGFYVERWDARGKRFERVHRELLAGLLHATQGGTYRFADESASPYEAQIYRLVEVTADGRTKLHGPYARRVEIGSPRSEMEGDFERSPHATRKAAAVPFAAKGLLAAKARPAPHGVHLSVEETGLYYLSASQIAGWLDIEEKQAEKKIADGKVTLTQGGQPVAYRPDFAAPDKREKRALGLFFYGEALDSLYSKANVYRLEKDKGGLLMSLLSVPGASGAAGGSYVSALHLEQDAFPATAIAPDPESDYWFWEFVQGGDPTFGVRSFAFDAPGVDAAEDAGLTVSLFGATASGVDGEHHIEVRLNGTLLGETAWEGIAPHQATFAVPSGLLAESGNQVEVTGLVGVGAPFSIVYVASFDLSYVRSYRAAGDRLAFTVPGGSPVGVDGFASPAVFLLDVANPRRPRWIEGGLVEPDGSGGNRLGFTPASPLTLFAAGGSALDAPVAVRPWTEAASRSVRSGGQYLVIAPPELRDAALRLAAYRAGGGLSTAVVDTDQIFDELSAGIPTPHALRSFVAGALATWRTKPRYLVLAGEGTLDYRNLLGFGDSVLPPLMVQAVQGLFPSDNRLGDADNDGLPDLAVGRIPVLTSAELDAYRVKIAAYEASGQPAWAGQGLLLADGDDGAASFAADSARVAAAFDSTFALDAIDLQSLPLASARAQLFAALTDGRSFVNYLGHGGLDRLSGSGLLTSADVPSLANGARLPVLTAMTCTVNRFAVPGVPALGELLVKSAGGGAAAVWGPTGLSDNAQARLLAERFYRQTGGPASVQGVLGDWILTSLRDFRDLGGDTSLVNIYNLLGDPGLRIRSGPEPLPSGGSPGE